MECFLASVFSSSCFLICMISVIATLGRKKSSFVLDQKQSQENICGSFCLLFIYF